jgi:hypothetical protein
MSRLCRCGHTHHDGALTGACPECGEGWQCIPLHVRRLATSWSLTHLKDI